MQAWTEMLDDETGQRAKNRVSDTIKRRRYHRQGDCMNRMSLSTSIGLVAGFATALSAQTVPSDCGKVDQKTIQNITVKVTGCIADPSVLSPHPAVIQEPVLQPQRILEASPFGAEGSAPFSLGHDLSKYREFQLGVSILAVAMQVVFKPPLTT